MPAFPGALAKVVFDNWHHMVMGDYVPPPCPPFKLLKQFMEVCYIAASSPEEARYPQFNVVAVPKQQSNASEAFGKNWRFTSSRLFNVGELRRLAPAVDLKKSAIWAVWDEEKWSISGLVDLGTSWHRARAGLEYRYRHPGSLLIQIDRPGRMRVYQGALHVATLADGEIEGLNGIDLNLFLHQPANAGLLRMNESIDHPAYEHPRDFEGFQFIALWNTYAAIANSISLAGHGGMLIIVPGDHGINHRLVKLKYEINSLILRDSFIKFINLRHVFNDYVELLDDGYGVPDDVVHKANLKMRDAYEALVEATRFVASLAGCDGSIVISDDLKLLGFGGEIRAELSSEVKIYDVAKEMPRKGKACDIEQFGMRHRAAVKLASQDQDCRILAISQDGPISGIWWEKGRVLVKKGVKLSNLNMPWS